MDTDATTILVVDGCPEDRELLRRLLRRVPDHRYRIVEADDAAAGLALWDEHRPDCILLDYDLPDMTGLDVLERLLPRTTAGEVAVVMLTGRGSESVAVQAMSRMSQDYLVKSGLTTPLLHLSITSALQKRGLRRQILDRQEELERFAHTAAHDLKSPLVTVSGYCGALRRLDEVTGSARAMGYVERIETASAHMATLLDALLEYARAGRTTVGFETVDLGEVVAGVLEQLQGAIAASGASVDVGDLPVIEGDTAGLMQLFLNLIGNALKFRGAEPPRVSVGASPGAKPDGSEHEVAVRDNGIGFDPAHAERIFAPCRRLHDSSSYEGTGLGLAICRKVVERHGGTISAESQPGQGATFRIRLPAQRVSSLEARSARATA